MPERYFGKVVKIIDSFTIVIDKGEEHGVKKDSIFLVVGIGDEIVDPDTNAVLERLEIVRGCVIATHVQQKITTLKSNEYIKLKEIKEIKTTRSGGGGLLGSLMQGHETSEIIRPGEMRLKEIEKVQLGDVMIKM